MQLWSEVGRNDQESRSTGGGSVSDGEHGSTGTRPDGDHHSDRSTGAASTATAWPEARQVPSLDEVAHVAPTEAPALRPQHSRRRRRHRIIVWSSVALLLVMVVSAGLVAAQRIGRPLPRLQVTGGAVTSSVVQGPALLPPWPLAGQAAVAIPALKYAQQSGPEQPVPIASLTKMTTAVVVLRDHPLPLGSNGPTVTITSDEAGQFDKDLANDETNIPLQAGETLTELQLLEALLVASADDAAYTLAVWDAGSPQVFVDKMNLVAVSLGAVHSHYVDASGFDPRSVSTAADTLRIASAGMAIPTFASVAGLPTVNVPGAGVVHNIVPEIGTNGIVGVKSGYTSQASGCMVLAGYRSVRGRSVLVLASALGQREPAPPAPPSATPSTTQAPVAAAAPKAPTTTMPYSAIEAKYPLRYTEPIVEHLLDDTEAAIVPVPAVTAGETVGRAASEWGGAGQAVPLLAESGAWLLGVPGQRVNATLTSLHPTRGRSGAGSSGVVRFTLGLQTESVPVRLERRVPNPGWWWKLLHD